MDRIIYTAMSGARQILDQQGVVSHNLANATTTGFRAQLTAMSEASMPADALYNTRIPVMVTTPGADFSSGPISATGRDLDVAIDGDGWLAVQAADGSEAYTRRGDLQVDSNGLVMSGARPVIGAGGPITVPLGAKLSVGTDGTISAIGEGEDPDSLVEVARLKLVTAGEQPLLRGDDGLFRAAPGANGEAATLPQDENVRLAPGSLEGSNVSPLESMVAMIDCARSYEMQLKIIETADQNAQRANSLLSIQG
ncbi:flagellar basal body rod protein FlgF [Porticoccus sp.]